MGALELRGHRDRLTGHFAPGKIHLQRGERREKMMFRGLDLAKGWIAVPSTDHGRNENVENHHELNPGLNLSCLKDVK